MKKREERQERKCTLKYLEVPQAATKLIKQIMLLSLFKWFLCSKLEKRIQTYIETLIIKRKSKKCERIKKALIICFSPLYRVHFSEGLNNQNILWDTKTRFTPLSRPIAKITNHASNC